MRKGKWRKWAGGALALGMAFSMLPVGNAEASANVEERIKYYYGDADCDGEVNTKDALLILKTSLDLTTLDEGLQYTLANVYTEDEISAKDALETLKISLGLKEKVRYLAEPAYYVPESIEETGKDNIGFPGADGFGKEATGGRGGKVYEVTNLNDSGEGSLRAAVEAEGARIIVFKVSGTIYLNSTLTIRNGDVTIAGQTAPGDGICLANYGLNIHHAENVIVRYLRIRPGDMGAALDTVKGKDPGSLAEPDAIDVNASKYVIIDHCSTSWAVDETLSVRTNGKGETYDDVSDNVSVQWCTVTESLTKAPFIGTRHGMGSLIRGAWGAKITYHHNFYSTHSSRMPMCGSYMDNKSNDGYFQLEWINNVVYNWSGNSSGKSSDIDANGELIYTTNINNINNVYKPGPLSVANYAFSEAGMGNHLYISGNQMNGVVPVDQKSLVIFEKDVQATDKNPYYVKSGQVLDQDAYFLDKPFDFSKMTNIQQAKEAEMAVLTGAGVSLYRDSVDRGVVEAYFNGTGKLINHPAESIGWDGPTLPKEYIKDNNVKNAQGYYDFFQKNYPKLECLNGYIDSDKDGMSDEWEDFMGLDKTDASDGAELYGETNYTNLEVFLQYLVENPEAAAAR